MLSDWVGLFASGDGWVAGLGVVASGLSGLAGWSVAELEMLLLVKSVGSWAWPGTEALTGEAEGEGEVVCGLAGVAGRVTE